MTRTKHPGAAHAGIRRLVNAASLGGVIGSALLVAPDHAAAWCRTTTDQTLPTSSTTCVTTGTPLIWTRRCQGFSLDVGGGGGLSVAAVRSAVSASFDTWSGIDCGVGRAFDVSESLPVACDRAEYSSGDDGNSNTIAFANDFSVRMYPDDAIAVTVVWHNVDSGEIYDADMIINEQMGPFVTCGSLCAPNATAFDLQNVVTHEAGHFLGLAHSADTSATMFYRADVGETGKRTLAQDDVDGFCDAYGDGAVPAECDSTPRHGFDADCEREPDSGRGCGCSLVGSVDRQGGGTGGSGGTSTSGGTSGTKSSVVVLIGLVAILAPRTKRKSGAAIQV